MQQVAKAAAAAAAAAAGVQVRFDIIKFSHARFLKFGWKQTVLPRGRGG